MKESLRGKNFSFKGLIFMAFVAFMSFTSTLWETDLAASVSAQKPPTTAELYEKNCQQCHGPGGKAPAPEMSFVGREWKHGTSTAAIVKTITKGVEGTAMLPWEGRLKPAEIQALAKLVRSFDKRLKPEPARGRGGRNLELRTENLELRASHTGGMRSPVRSVLVLSSEF
jgi:mono/diheme cytochrome c family protein